MDLNLDFKQGFGPEDMEETFQSMISETDSRLEVRMVQAGLNIEKEAKRRVPVDTGNLRASIASETETDRNTITSHTGTNVEYSDDVEYGTSSSEAQPYLRPAMDKETRDLIRDVEQLVYRVAEQEGNG